METDIREEDLRLLLLLGCPQCRDNRISVSYDGATYYPSIGLQFEGREAVDNLVIWGQAIDEPFVRPTVVMCNSCRGILYMDGAWTADAMMMFRLYRESERWNSKPAEIKGQLDEGLPIKKAIPIELRFGEYDVAAIHHETQTWGCSKDAPSAVDDLKRKLTMLCEHYLSRPRAVPGTYADVWTRLFDEHIEKV